MRLTRCADVCTVLAAAAVTVQVTMTTPYPTNVGPIKDKLREAAVLAGCTDVHREKDGERVRQDPREAAVTIVTKQDGSIEYQVDCDLRGGQR